MGTMSDSTKIEDEVQMKSDEVETLKWVIQQQVTTFKQICRFEMRERHDLNTVVTVLNCTFS